MDFTRLRIQMLSRVSETGRSTRKTSRCTDHRMDVQAAEPLSQGRFPSNPTPEIAGGDCKNSSWRQKKVECEFSEQLDELKVLPIIQMIDSKEEKKCCRHPQNLLDIRLRPQQPHLKTKTWRQDLSQQLHSQAPKSKLEQNKT